MIDPPQSIVDAVVWELGRSHGISTDEPDIVATFTDTLRSRGRLRFIDVNSAAFDDDSFYLLDGRGHRCRIDVDRLGEPCELQCERSVEAIPLLIPMLSLRLLRKGYVLLHASSFVYHGTGVLVTGWKKGGKTEMLLPFMAEGASYLADEWTIVSGDGTLWGLAGVTQIWDWHLQQLPKLWRRIRSRDRLRIRLIELYRRIYRALPASAARALSLLPALGRLHLVGGSPELAQVRIAPQVLFPRQVREAPANLDRLFLAVAGEGETRVSPLDPEAAARRIVASLVYERSGLCAAYQQFLYAFPARHNRLLEGASEDEHRALAHVFRNRVAFEVSHPYPVPLRNLFVATAPLC